MIKAGTRVPGPYGSCAPANNSLLPFGRALEFRRNFGAAREGKNPTCSRKQRQESSLEFSLS
jgi:hypothetical protein